MTLPWLVVLLIYGIVNGFGQIPLLAWLVLIPFYLQDDYDSRHKR